MDYNNIIESVDEILPGLWLGNEAISQSAKFVKEKNIKLIVNATKNIPSKFLGQIYYVRVPVDDPGPSSRGSEALREIQIMKESLPMVLKIISKFRRRNCPVLIHCHAGAQRSAIITAAYLIYTGNAKNADDAINKVIEKRSIAFFSGKSVNFRNSLSIY